MAKFVNPYAMDGEIAKKILNKEQILGDTSKFLDIPKFEDEEDKQLTVIHIINVDDYNSINFNMIKEVANNYFFRLGVSVRAVFFSKNWKYFDFDNITDSEGICLIGNPFNIKKFLTQKYYLKYNIENCNNPKYLGQDGMLTNLPDNIRKNDIFEYLWKVSEDLNNTNPETSTGAGTTDLDLENKNINIVSIDLEGTKIFSEKSLKVKDGIVETIAFFLVHGVGHNSKIINKNGYLDDGTYSHLFGGIMLTGTGLINFSESQPKNIPPLEHEYHNKNIFLKLLVTKPILSVATEFEKITISSNKIYFDAVEKRFEKQKKTRNEY